MAAVGNTPMLSIDGIFASRPLLSVSVYPY